MRRIGLPPETRNFIPHITLARLNRIEPEPIYRYIEAHNLFVCPSFRAERVTLFLVAPVKGRWSLCRGKTLSDEDRQED